MSEDEANNALMKDIQFSRAILKLKNTSDERFLSAKKCFHDARLKANEAFCNEGLKLSDRIMATKLRVVSKILENLDDTKAATCCCMSFLEALHTLPAVGNTFLTYFKGGFKAMFDENKRLETVRSVLSLNFAVLKIVASAGELPNVGKWPRITLDEEQNKTETIHPLFLCADDVDDIFDNKGLCLPEVNFISAEKDSWHEHCCINSQNQLLYSNENQINISSRSGPSNITMFCQLRQATANVKNNEQEVKALAVDHCDNVFVIVPFEKSNGGEDF